MKTEKFEFEDIPFYIERVNDSDFLLVYNTGNMLVGILDTSTSKQGMNLENLDRILSDRIYEIHKLLKRAEVKI